MRVAESSACESDGSLITAQPDCCSEPCHGEAQPDPQTCTDPESSRSELRQRNKMRIDRDVTLRIEGESGGSEPKQAVFQQGAEIRSEERNLFDDADCEQRQDGP